MGRSPIAPPQGGKKASLRVGVEAHWLMFHLAGLLALFAAAHSLAAEPAPFLVTRNLTYADRNGTRLLLDAYVPKADGPLPAVLVVHGGAWVMGDKDQLAAYAKGLAEQGFAAFAINYRLAPKSKHPAQIEDCREAIRWMRTTGAKHKVDPDRIGAVGYSAGGHLVSLLAVTGRDAQADPGKVGTRIRAAVAGGAPVDFREVPRDAGLFTYWLGDTRAKAPGLYVDASPSAHLTPDDAPVFFYHGTKDWLVPEAPARAMSQALMKHGVASAFHTVKDADHIGAALSAEALLEGIIFFTRHLRPRPPGGATSPKAP